VVSASQQFSDRVSTLTAHFIHQGYSGPDAPNAAQGYIYHLLQRQVSLLAFMDCFRVIAWITLAAVPLMLFVRHFKPTGKAPAAH
jgi:DHA2 family multidrug resistance protein